MFFIEVLWISSSLSCASTHSAPSWTSPSGDPPCPLTRALFLYVLYVNHMFKAIAGVTAALVCMTGPQLPEAHAAADCDLLDSGVLICSKQMSSSVERLGVMDPDGRTAFIGDVTCTSSEWILHGGWTGYVSLETASGYAEAYCEGRGNMFI